MEIEFEKPYLKQLYETGKAENKKHRYQPDIVKRYINTINRLIIAKSTEELYTIKSLNYETLKGNKKGLSSIRVNNKYRIEFRLLEDGEEPNSIEICSIVELSNHYK